MMLRGSLLAFGTAVILLQGRPAQQNWTPQEMVAAHNVYRAQVGVPGLRWSRDLAQRAQQWANTLIEKQAFTPRRDGVFGENLYEVVGGGSTPTEVVKAWASERAYYDYKTNSCSARCGHYTQVVWRGTKEVGCAVARKGEREVWVCNYDPPGNVVGERPY